MMIVSKLVRFDRVNDLRTFQETNEFWSGFIYAAMKAKNVIFGTFQTQFWLLIWEDDFFDIFFIKLNLSTSSNHLREATG